jgi:hypothetical protein
VLGNYLGKTTRNFFLGIRTPWTLASDEVWRRTHRLGGWTMVGAGVALVVMGLFGASELALLVIVAAAALIPVVLLRLAGAGRLQTSSRRRIACCLKQEAPALRGLLAYTQCGGAPGPRSTAGQVFDAR